MPQLTRSASAAVKTLERKKVLFTILENLNAALTPPVCHHKFYNMRKPIYSHVVTRAHKHVIIPKVVQKANSLSLPQQQLKQAAAQSQAKQPNIIRQSNAAVVKTKPRFKLGKPKPEPAQRRGGAKVTYFKRDTSEESKRRIRELKDSGNGRILVVIGNGPSILNAELERLVGHPKIDIMSINKPDKRVWPSKYWLFCDSSQFKRNKDLWDAYDGILLNTPSIQAKHNTIHIINLTNRAGFSKNLVDGFFLGRSSVFCSMQVAYWMQYDHTYIYGCDMNSVIVNGQQMLHFYGQNPDVVAKNRMDRFALEAKSYEYAANVLTAAERSKYTFCTAHNKFQFVEKFNRLDERASVDVVLAAADAL